MKLLEIHSQSDWDSFQTAQPFAQFLQSWTWGEFQKTCGSPVRRFALVDSDGSWLAAIQMEYRKRRFGLGYSFAPRGPVFALSVPFEKRNEILTTLTQKLLNVSGLTKGCLFWRIEPMSELAKPEGLVPLTFRHQTAVNPSSTFILDLDQTEADLLAAMHEKTRYNIRVASRHHVVTRLAASDADVKTFLDLMDETAKRDGFTQHSRTYLEKTYRYLLEAGMGRIRLAEVGETILSANLEVMFGDTVTYLYGTSSSQQRNAMAPFALHWSAIQAAKAEGYKLYDFWGANPQSKGMYSYKPSWEGITRFKQGWGGRRINLVGTWDLPFHETFYRLIFLKKFFRG